MLKTNQKLQPARINIREIPAQVVRHAMGFLPYKDVVSCKRVFKTIGMLDYLSWARRSGYIEVGQLKRAFKAQGVTSPENRAIEETKRIGSSLLKMDLLNFGKTESCLLLKGEAQDWSPFFPHLRTLRLNGRDFDKATFNSISQKAPRVTHLTLNGTPTPEYQRVFKQFANLESLELADREGHEFHVSRTDLIALADHPTLQELLIATSDQMYLYEQDLEPISNIPHLRHLHLSGLFLSGIHPSILRKAPALKKVTLDHIKSNEQPPVRTFLNPIVSSLQTVKNIEELVICTDVADDVFSSIGKCVHLRAITVVMDFVLGITDDAIAPLASCSELRSLKIAINEFDPRGDEFQPKLTTQGIVDLVKKLPRLLMLDVDHVAFSQLDVAKVEVALRDSHPQLVVKKNRNQEEL